jgi:hypothetical protein
MMTVASIVVTYLGIGCIKGILEFVIAQKAFRDHPNTNMLSGPDMLARCLIKNAIAWPVFLFWLALLGAFKVFIFFRGSGRCKPDG